MGAGPFFPTLAEEGCGIFAVIESVTGHYGVSETIAPHLRDGYRGVGGCDACASGGHHWVSL
jgi:hypothetical protein